MRVIAQSWAKATSLCPSLKGICSQFTDNYLNIPRNSIVYYSPLGASINAENHELTSAPVIRNNNEQSAKRVACSESLIVRNSFHSYICCITQVDETRRRETWNDNNRGTSHIQPSTNVQALRTIRFKSNCVCYVSCHHWITLLNESCSLGLKAMGKWISMQSPSQSLGDTTNHHAEELNRSGIRDVTPWWSQLLHESCSLGLKAMRKCIAMQPPSQSLACCDEPLCRVT